MHPRDRDVRRPDTGVDPRGSGGGPPPLLQGYLKRRKGTGPATGPADPESPKAPEANEMPAKVAARKRPRAAKPKA